MSAAPTSTFTTQASTFPRYTRYKDSGVEWLGEVPAHWKVEKGKWLFSKMNRPIRKIDGVVTAFRDGQVTLRTNRRTNGFTNAIKEHGYQGYPKKRYGFAVILRLHSSLHGTQWIHHHTC